MKRQMLPLALFVFGNSLLPAAVLTTKEFERSIQTRVALAEPDWLPKDPSPYQRANPDGRQHLMLRWRAREGKEVLVADSRKRMISHPRPDVGVEVFLCNSVEDARSALREGSEGSVPNKPDGIMEELGDMAFIWRGRPDSITVIRVIVGRLYLCTVGPSPELAMRFARLAVEQIEGVLKEAGERP